MSGMPTATATGPVNAISSSDSSEEGNEGNELTSAGRCREARNLAEKHRRDKLTSSISELMKMVPHVTDSTRRVDKTAVLRLATHGLRLQHVFGKTAWGKDSLEAQRTMTMTLLNMIDGFFLTLTLHGQIVLISSTVEKLLGYAHQDLYGTNIFQITHPDDVARFKELLIPTDLDSLLNDMVSTSDNYEQSNRTETETETEKEREKEKKSTTSMNPTTFEFSVFRKHHPQFYGDVEEDEFYKGIDDVNRKLLSDKRCFTVRLAKYLVRPKEKPCYEYVKICGNFRRSDYSTAPSRHNYPLQKHQLRRSRSQSISEDGYKSSDFSSAKGPWTMHDALARAAMHGVSGNDIVLVGMAKIIPPDRVQRCFMEAHRLEYRTRHLIDGRIVECDQRISLVAGYLNEEVRNLSPFSFMHQDDVRWVVVALRQMYDCNSNYGESYFRLLSRNGNFIYLQTKGFLEIDNKTKKVHSFVCINTLLTEDEGRKKVQEMKNRFSVIINGKAPTCSTQDVPASQNPQQLERIVMYLIENLQNPNEVSTISSYKNINKDDKNEQSYNEKEDLKARKVIPISSVSPPADRNPNDNQSLSLVAPERSSVKNSITKSVKVVNITAAKYSLLKNQKRIGKKRPTAPTLPSNPEGQTDFVKQKRPSVIQLNSVQANTPESLCSLSPVSLSNSSNNSNSSSISSPKTSVSSPRPQSQNLSLQQNKPPPPQPEERSILKELLGHYKPQVTVNNVVPLPSFRVFSGVTNTKSSAKQIRPKIPLQKGNKLSNTNQQKQPVTPRRKQTISVSSLTLNTTRQILPPKYPNNTYNAVQQMQSQMLPSDTFQKNSNVVYNSNVQPNQAIIQLPQQLNYAYNSNQQMDIATPQHFNYAYNTNPQLESQTNTLCSYNTSNQKDIQSQNLNYIYNTNQQIQSHNLPSISNMLCNQNQQINIAICSNYFDNSNQQIKPALPPPYNTPPLPPPPPPPPYDPNTYCNTNQQIVLQKEPLPQPNNYSYEPNQQQLVHQQMQLNSNSNLNSNYNYNFNEQQMALPTNLNFNYNPSQQNVSQQIPQILHPDPIFNANQQTNLRLESQILHTDLNYTSISNQEMPSAVAPLITDQQQLSEGVNPSNQDINSELLSLKPNFLSSTEVAETLQILQQELPFSEGGYIQPTDSQLSEYLPDNVLDFLPL